MISVKMTQNGNKTEKSLKQMLEASKEISGTKKITFGDLFTTTFMRKYTSFESLDELLKAGGFNPDDFDTIPQNTLDEYIASSSIFNGWTDILEKAESEYVDELLGLSGF